MRGGRRVVEAPPGRRLPQLVRRRDGGSPYGRAGARPSPVRRWDGGFPSCCAARMAALHAVARERATGGSAGRLAPPGDGGHAGRVTLPLPLRSRVRRSPSTPCSYRQTARNRECTATKSTAKSHLTRCSHKSYYNKSYYKSRN